MSVIVVSPRKSPRRPVSQLSPPKTPPGWKKPSDVMRSSMRRIRQGALNARLNGLNSLAKPETLKNASPTTSSKRKNPFRKANEHTPSPKKVRECDEGETHNDEVLFKFLGLNNPGSSQDFNFLELSTSVIPETTCEESTICRGAPYLPVDWTLRDKIKFYSRKPFPWNQTLKLSEEASGITGFVRCIESEDELGGGLNTSPNATFHQFCLYWQHPNLPWLELFPRSKVGKVDTTKVPALTAYPHIRDSLHRDWSESFRALLQLLRARLCPYFYVMANSFNCLFRANGINGSDEVSVFVNPTTRGFRKLLSTDGVHFTMPLRKSTKRVSEEIGDDDEEESEAQTETSDLLADLGLDAEDIKKMHSTEELFTFKTESKEEGKEESLVLVEGSDVNAFFNFLINCKSIVSTSGPLIGVPPTLLAPVAFTGGSLMSLKVRQSTVSVENESFHSIELRGPILPHAVHNLCNVSQQTADDFSVTLANMESTKAFTLAAGASCSKNRTEVLSPNKIKVGSLIDCGLKPKTLGSFCSDNVTLFDSVKFSNGLFTCS